MSRTALFEVGITYCDGVNFAHAHEEAKPAIGEYAEMIAEAFEPTNKDTPNARHIRMVSLVAFDEEGEIVHHINTGVVECSHTGPITVELPDRV